MNVYSMLFYTILLIVILVLVIRLMWPLLWILLIGYAIYYLYRAYQYHKMEKKLREAKQTFEEEWENVTQSQAYQERSGSRGGNVIDADYTVKDEERTGQS